MTLIRFNCIHLAVRGECGTHSTPHRWQHSTLRGHECLCEWVCALARVQNKRNPWNWMYVQLVFVGSEGVRGCMHVLLRWVLKWVKGMIKQMKRYRRDRTRRLRCMCTLGVYGACMPCGYSGMNIHLSHNTNKHIDPPLLYTVRYKRKAISSPSPTLGEA